MTIYNSDTLFVEYTLPKIMLRWETNEGSNTINLTIKQARDLTRELSLIADKIEGK